jgi:hypothetical protein
MAAFSFLFLGFEAHLTDRYHAAWKGFGLVAKNEYLISFHPIKEIMMSRHEY